MNPAFRKPLALLVIVLGVLPTRAEVAAAMSSVRGQLGLEQKLKPESFLRDSGMAVQQANMAPWPKVTLESRQRSKRFLEGRNPYLSDPHFIGSRSAVAFADDAIEREAA